MTNYSKTMAEALMEVRKIEEATMKASQIAQLKKAYEPMRGKKISTGNAQKLSKMMDKFDDNKQLMIQLVKADIPFVSSLAVTRLISKHNMKGVEINKLKKEEVEFWESLEEHKGDKPHKHPHDEDELDETKYKVSVEGMPPVYMDAKSVGEIKTSLRKLLKNPDMINDIERVTDAIIKKDLRGRIAGKDDKDDEEEVKKEDMTVSGTSGVGVISQKDLDHVQKELRRFGVKDAVVGLNKKDSTKIDVKTKMSNAVVKKAFDKSKMTVLYNHVELDENKLPDMREALRQVRTEKPIQLDEVNFNIGDKVKVVPKAKGSKPFSGKITGKLKNGKHEVQVYNKNVSHMNIMAHELVKEEVDLDEWTVSDVEIAMKKKYGKIDKEAIEKLKKVQYRGNVDRNDLVKAGHGKLDVAGLAYSKEEVDLDEEKSDYTIVAIKNKKVVDQQHSISKSEFKDAIKLFKKNNPGAKISIEDKGGKIVHTEEVDLDEALKVGSKINLPKGVGFWDTTNFPIGGKFGRVTDAKGLQITVSRVFKPSGQTKMSDTEGETKDGRKIAFKSGLVESVELDEKTKWKMGDGRPRGGSHIENVRFWDLSKDELQYIMKDAGEAMKANPTARKATSGPGNWADQVNDALTVLAWRKKNGIKEEVELDERELTDTEKKRREEIAQDMNDTDFKDRYGDRWKEVKMAVATKQAKNEEVELGIAARVAEQLARIKGNSPAAQGWRPATEAELEEGKMKELHGYIAQGKSAEWIAKKMKVDVEAIKTLMAGYNESYEIGTNEYRDYLEKLTPGEGTQEASAQADAMRAMRRGKKEVDPADIDIDASPEDRAAADKNIIMQLRGVVSLKGVGKMILTPQQARKLKKKDSKYLKTLGSGFVEFEKGHEKVDLKVAQAILDKFNSLKKPADKEKFQAKVAKSYKDMLKALKEEVELDEDRFGDFQDFARLYGGGDEIYVVTQGKDASGGRGEHQQKVVGIAKDPNKAKKIRDAANKQNPKAKARIYGQMKKSQKIFKLKVGDPVSFEDSKNKLSYIEEVELDEGKMKDLSMKIDDVVAKMKKNRNMKGFADKFKKDVMKSMDIEKSLEKVLPDYIAGKDIQKLMGEEVDLDEALPSHLQKHFDKDGNPKSKEGKAAWERLAKMKGYRKYTSKQVKMAIGIAFDKRYVQGNMTGAVNAIEKIAKGLSEIEPVRNALRRANEEVVNEGTWAVPKTPKQKRELKKLLSKPLKAKGATDKLYDIIGDDDLFDQIDDFASTEPNADVRSMVKTAMKRLGIKEEVKETILDRIDRKLKERKNG